MKRALEQLVSDEEAMDAAVELGILWIIALGGIAWSSFGGAS